jgi:hypothetical protein
MPLSLTESNWRGNAGNPPGNTDLASGMQLSRYTGNIADTHVPEKKLYCSYWLRHGECDYLQQGCKYLHVMPTDVETLNRCGLRDIPRWYRNQMQQQSQRDQGLLPHATNSLLESGLAGSMPSILPIIPMSPPITPSRAGSRFPHEQLRMNGLVNTMSTGMGAIMPTPGSYNTTFATKVQGGEQGISTTQSTFDSNMAAFSPFGLPSLSGSATPFMPSRSPDGLNPSTGVRINTTVSRYDPFAPSPYANTIANTSNGNNANENGANNRRLMARETSETGFFARINDKSSGNSENVSPIGSRPSTNLPAKE